jgi:hypothetical protein
MAYPFASLVLLAWVPFTLVMCSRLPAPLAVSISIVGAGALLPNALAFDFPGVPPLDRDAIAAIASFAGCVLMHPRYMRARPPGSGIEVFTIAIALAAFCTALTNRDPVHLSSIRMPPLSLYDGISMTAAAVITFGIPLYLGRALFRTPRDLAVLLGVLAIGGLMYSVPVLWEIRMSPGLHEFVYGFKAEDFAQAKRGGLWGWRPMVFVGHGLSLAMLLGACGVAAAGLWRARSAIVRGMGVVLTPYLYALLIACSSLGALVLSTAALPCVMLLRPSFQGRIMMLLCVAVLTYPVTRALDVFPSTWLVEQAEQISEDRAASLRFRFDNEDELIDRARERILFGWGGYNRNRVYDAETDKASVTDGFWIIMLGQRGIIGFLCVFGLLIVPVFAAGRALGRHAGGANAVLVATTAWLATLSAVDLLPNGFLSARNVLICGALLGAIQGWDARTTRAEESGERTEPEPAEPENAPLVPTR